MSARGGEPDRGTDPPEHPRIGPVVLVPEFVTRGDDDPWVHRKGEPRYFAFFWTLYLLLSSLLTVFSIRSVGIPTQDQFLLGGRGMALMCSLGVLPLWPMVRLSQTRAPHPLSASFLDGLIVVLPSCAVLLPLSLLTGWTLHVSLAICSVMFVWMVVSGGIVALGTARDGRVWRLGAMALVWALAMAAPLASWGGTRAGLWEASSGIPERIELLSPLSALFPLTEPAGGAVLSFSVDRQAFAWIAAPLALGLALWAVAALVLGRGSTRGDA